MQQSINQKNVTDVKILLQIEKYKQEIQRLKQNKYPEHEMEYFQGHIDSLEGTIMDLLEILQK